MNDPGWGRNQNQNQNNDNQRPGGQRPGNDDGPPDLDELWRDMNQRLNSLFGRGGNGGGPRGPGDGGPTMRGALIGLGVLAVIGLGLWLASGIYIIREGQSSIELQFGKFVRQKDNAGLTARWP
jgi:membrane protease subunit HflK